MSGAFQKTEQKQVSGAVPAGLWLDPMRLQRSSGFNGTELRRIQRMIEEHHSQLVEAWNAYFGT